MSRIISHVKAIDELEIRQLPSKKLVRIKQAVRVGAITVLLGENRQLYCDQLRGYAYMPGMWPWTEPLMQALVQIGAITTAQAEEHVRRCQAISDRKDRQYHRERLASLAEQYGFEITEEQRTALRWEEEQV